MFLLNSISDTSMADRRFFFGHFAFFVFLVAVNFSNRHHNYYSAWRYVTKEDPNYEQSEGHPDLSDGEPKTSKASKRTVEARRLISRCVTTIILGLHDQPFCI